MFSIGVLQDVAIALAATFLNSRVFWFLAERWPDSRAKALVLDGLAGTLMICLGAVTAGEPGSIELGKALALYTLPIAAVLAMDLRRLGKVSPSDAETTAPDFQKTR